MKGIVFTEFLEMVEDKFGLAVADDIIEKSDLPSDGIYTSVGTYDHSKILSLVTNLSEKTGVPVPALVKTYGTYLFTRFHVKYPAFFERPSSSFEFLSSIEDTIHTEVRKLHHDAELPTFAHEFQGDNHMTLTYRSSRPFADLAHGLIEGCIEHYGETVEIEREDISPPPETCVKFELTRLAA